MDWIAFLFSYILSWTNLVVVICITVAGYIYPSLANFLKVYNTVSKAVGDIWNTVKGFWQRWRQQTSLNTDSRPLDTDSGPLDTDSVPPDESVGPPLSDDSAVEIIESKISSRWKQLGRRLGMTDDELDNIDSDYKGQKEKAHQMLRAYRNKADQPILDKLVEACQGCGRMDIAREILKLKQE